MSFMDMLPKSDADRKQNTSEKNAISPQKDSAEKAKSVEKDEVKNDTSSKNINEKG